MGSYWRHTYHLVWAVKNRESLISPRVEAELHAFLAARASSQGCPVFAVNGMPDHVHLVLAIPPSHSVSAVVKDLKGASSHQLNHGSSSFDIRFAWQTGFGSLTVSAANRPRAIAYVLNQKQHHADGTTHSALERYSEDDSIDDASS